MVPGRLDGQWQLLHPWLRQGPGRYPEEGLVSRRLARERQLLHPLRVRSWKDPGKYRHFQTNAKPNEMANRSRSSRDDCRPSHSSGSDEQMFGGEQQVSHSE
jgi:hypothetical protein